MKANPELREKMWELCYDLLPDDERAALVATIKSDPQAARLYAEVRLQADLVGFAAKVEDSSLIFAPEGKEFQSRDLAPAAAHRKAAASAPAEPRDSIPSGRRSWIAWLPAVAALLLVGLIGYGAYRPLTPRGEQAKFVVTQISIPGSMPEGLSSRVAFRSSSLAGEPQPAELDVRLVDAAGEVLHHEVVPTDAGGLAAIMLPGQAVQTGVRIEATARQRDVRGELMVEQDEARLAESDSSATAALPVEQQPPLVYYMPDRPLAEPGETLRYAKYKVSRFGFQMEVAEVEDLVVNDPRADRLAANGQAADDRPADDPTAGSRPAAVPYSREGEERTYEEGTRKESVWRELERQAGQQQRSRGYAYGAAPGVSAAAASGLGVSEPRAQGLGSASGSEKPAGGEAAPLGAKDEKVLEDDAFAKRQLASETKQLRELTDRTSERFYDQDAAEAVIVEPGAPVPFDVPAELAGKNKNLRVEAMLRGVRVASAPVAEAAQQPDEQAGAAQAGAPQPAAQTYNFTLDLPPEADGEIQMRVIDASQSPPQVVRQQTVFRRPSRQLKLTMDDPQNQFHPGQAVKLRLQVLNEHDQPQAATLGVRVWNEAHVQASGQSPALVADVMRSTSERFDGSGHAQTRDRLLALDTVEKLEADKLAKDELREIQSAKKGDGLFRGGRPTTAAEPAPPAPAATASAEPEPTPSASAPTESTPPAPARAETTPAPAGTPPAAIAPVARPDAPSAEGATPAQAASVFGNGREEMAETPLYAGAPPAEADFDSPEPFVVSNHAAVARQSRALAAESQQAWQAWRAMVGRVLVIGGLVALVGLMLLFLVRMPVGAASGTLTLLAAAASLIVGGFWIGGGDRGVQIAAAPTIAKQGRLDDLPFRENLRQEDALLLGREDASAVSPAREPVDRYAKSDASSPRESFRFKESPAADSRLDGQAPAAGFGGTASPDAPKLAEARGPEPTVPADAAASPETKITAGAAGLEAPASSPQAAGRAGGFGGGGGAPAGALAPAKAGQRASQPGIGDAEKDSAEKPLLGKPGAEEPAANRASRRAMVPADRSAQGAPAPAEAPATPAPTAPALQAIEALQPDGRPGGGARDKLGQAESDRAKSDTATLDRTKLDSTKSKASAPAALYFNPRLATDAEGYATIEFQMPDVESDYRVLIDAFGQGRIGSAELLIMCRKDQ